MHWELAPAFTTADRDMATSAPMRLKVAPVAGVRVDFSRVIIVDVFCRMRNA
jgi:hypothetical protein